MKNKIYSILMLAIIVGFTSCKKDDETAADSTNLIEYDGTRSALKKGAILDFGAYSYYGTTDTHLNYDFYTTDGAIVSNTAGEIEDIQGKIGVWVWLESSGATVPFKTGTYTFIDGTGDTNLSDAQLKTKYENKLFIAGASLYINSNVNASFDANDTQEIEIKSGTVTVSGTTPNFTITYDLVMENNKTVKGSYNSGFQLFTE